MSTKNSNIDTKNENSSKDRKRMFHIGSRWMFGGQLAWSYSKMQAPGFLYAVYPSLKEIYKDNPEGLQNSITAKLNLFNTNPKAGNIITGMCVGIEESGGEDSIEVVEGLKTGLMGPGAGIGDSIFGVIIPTIMGSIAAYMAIDGSPIGSIIWIFVSIALLVLSLYFTYFGYEGGVRIVTDFQDKLNAFTKSAIFLGLIVVGGLIPTIVTANLNSEISIGEVPIDLQAMFDQIMPGLIPLLFLLFGYYLLGRKNITSTKLILIMMLIGIVLGALGVLV